MNIAAIADIQYFFIKPVILVKLNRRSFMTHGSYTAPENRRFHVMAYIVFTDLMVVNQPLL
jgi:hypothetical protein